MHLVDIHVSNSSDGTATVEFRGEGNELVSVRMMAGEGDRAVLRAKEIIAQLTAFGEVVTSLSTSKRGALRRATFTQTQSPSRVQRRAIHSESKQIGFDGLEWREPSLFSGVLAPKPWR